LNGDETLNDNLDFIINYILIHSLLDESYIMEYYRLLIESNNFDTEFGEWVDGLIEYIKNKYTDYFNEMIDIISKKYPEYSSEYITEEIYGILNKIENILFSSIINRLIIVKRRNKIMHRIRAQLEGLEYQGDYERAESIKNFIYGSIQKDMDVDNFIKYFDKIYFDWLDIMMTSDVDVISDLIYNMKSYRNDFEYNFKGIGAGFDSFIFDVYVLARMFRKFPGKDHIESDTVILFSGFDHTDLCAQYLQSQGAIVNKYDSGPGERCIYVPDSFI
jgi:hypothetical protein